MPLILQQEECCLLNARTPVIYISKSLNKTEQNYKIHDKEMLAVI